MEISETVQTNPDGALQIYQLCVCFYHIYCWASKGNQNFIQ
ncbi:unnamed protein product [Brassica oleracea var. botrytis]